METLIGKVLEQIQKDIKSKDLTAIVELLKAIPEENLKGYLSEEELRKYLDDIRDIFWFEELPIDIQNKICEEQVMDFKDTHEAGDNPFPDVETSRKYFLEEHDTCFYITGEDSSCVLDEEDYPRKKIKLRR